MKKPLPLPAVIATVVALLAIAGFFIYRNAGATAEFAAPATTKTIPRYVWDSMSPTMRDKMKSEGYTVSDVTPDAKGAPTGQPARASSGG